jgi:nitrate reductase delta subunit
MTVATIDAAALAGFLEYPWDRPSAPERAVAAKLKPLLKYIESHSLEELQELYSRTFDLTPVTPPYLAFHVHGETYRRGTVMARLRELYRHHDIDEAGELPDHLGNVLKLIARAGRDTAVAELVRDELVPGLAKLIEIAAKEEPKNPYRALLDAAQEVLTAHAAPPSKAPVSPQQAASRATSHPDGCALPPGMEPHPHPSPLPLAGGGCSKGFLP